MNSLNIAVWGMLVLVTIFKIPLQNFYRFVGGVVGGLSLLWKWTFNFITHRVWASIKLQTFRGRRKCQMLSSHWASLLGRRAVYCLSEFTGTRDKGERPLQTNGVCVGLRATWDTGFHSGKKRHQLKLLKKLFVTLVKSEPIEQEDSS